jgi:hypothetical protein
MNIDAISPMNFREVLFKTFDEHLTTISVFDFLLDPRSDCF